MRLSRTFAVVTASAFVLPAMAMSWFGWSALTRAEASATAEAGRISLSAERERLAALSEHAAQRIDAHLALVQLDVTHVAEAYGRAEPTGTPNTSQLARSYEGRETGGLPAYGFVHPVHGTFGDFEHRGSLSSWVPRPVLARLRTDAAALRATTRALHRLAQLAPHLERIGGRYGERLDLVWIVTTTGVGTVWPPYDYETWIRENPAILDLDESALDYVRLGAPDVNPDHGPRWTDPYLDRFKGVWMTSVIYPLYADGGFQGTAGADLLLATITNEVSTLDLGLPGYPLLLGPSGEVIATTPAGVDALGWDAEWQTALREAMRLPEDQTWTPAREEALQRGRLSTAPDAGWGALARTALGPAGLQDMTVGGVEHLVAHAPLQTPGWGLVLVVPTSAALSRADRVGVIVGENARELVGEYTVFATATFVLTLASAFLLRAVTIRPLESLARRVSRLTFDNLALAPDAARRADEFDELEAKVQELLSLLATTRDGERREHAQLDAILGAIDDAVVATDARGNLVHGNRGAEVLLGEPASALVGRPFSEVAPLVREIDGQRAADPVQAVLAAGRTTFTEDRLLLVRGGQSVPVELRAAPLAGGAGVVLLLRDAREARRYEDQLVRAQKLETVQVLASGIAHDFNNLLGGVLGYVSLARQVIPADSEAQARLERAELAVNRARGLTQQLVTFAKGGAPVRDANDLRTVLRDAALLPVRGSEVELDLALPDDLWTAPIDADQFGQVIQNLVKNAVEATARRGHIRVEAQNVTGSPSGLTRGPYVEIRVSDDGPGFTPEVERHLFDPFFTTRPGASGLGLAVAFAVVRKHHGNLEARSGPEGGATFTLWIPAGPQPSVSPTADATPRPGVRVLLLDDDPDLREVTAAMVAKLGHHADAVAEGTAAITAVERAIAEGLPYGLVLLDLSIPGGMGGAEALPHLRDRDPHLRAIVCSGYGKEGALADPGAWGFDGRLRKPFDLRSLAAEVSRVLAIRR